MKTIKYLSIFVLLIGFSFALVRCTKDEATKSELNASKIEYRIDNPCAPDLSNLPSCDSITHTISVQIPMYPGCSFTVEFFVWECDGGSAIAYHLSDYKIIDHNCNQYNIDLINAKNNNTINYFNMVFGKQIWYAITQWLLSGTASNISVVTVEYSIASCAKECYWQIRGSNAWVGRRYACGENCCKLKRVYNKINGEWVPTNKIVDFPLDPCYGARPVDCPDSRYQWSTDCTAQCEVLDF
ncbi:MAG: hypothetical protein IPH57_01300 [Saprospiraceae bacterium]|nr:hypothetical protein [Saprospiraceae bacterium]